MRIGTRWAAWLLFAVVAVGQAAEKTAAAQTYYFLVFNAPAAGQEEAYNRWYDTQHAPDVVSIPGFVSAQRFVYNEGVQLREVALKKPKYLVFYKIVTSDLPAVIAEVKRRLQTGETRVSDALDRNSGQMFIYRAFRPQVRGAGGDVPGAPAGPKQKYYQVVFGNAVAGKDVEFNTWYDKDHAPNMVGVPGFAWAQRAILNEVQMEPIPDAPRYLALFDIETSDLPAVLKQPTKGTEPPPAFDREHTYGYTYRAIGPELSGDAVRAERAGR